MVSPLTKPCQILTVAMRSRRYLSTEDLLGVAVILEKESQIDAALDLPGDRWRSMPIQASSYWIAVRIETGCRLLRGENGSMVSRAYLLLRNELMWHALYCVSQMCIFLKSTIWSSAVVQLNNSF